MAGANRQDERVAGLDLDCAAFRSAEHQRREAPENAERFVGGRMIMMIIEDRVAPLRGPAMVGKKLLEAFGRRLPFGFDRAAIEKDGQALVVRTPTIFVEDEGLWRDHDGAFVFRFAGSLSSIQTGV